MDRRYGAIEPEFDDEERVPLIRRSSLPARLKQPYVISAVFGVIALVGVIAVWAGFSSTPAIVHPAAPVIAPSLSNANVVHSVRTSTDAVSAGTSTDAVSASIEAEAPAAEFSQSAHYGAHAAAAAAAGHRPAKKSVRKIRQFLTRRDTKDRLTEQPEIPFVEDYQSDVTVTIEPHITFQEILGFGGAITDAVVHVWSQLDKQTRQRVIDLYFGENGNRYTLARIPINSCDFSLFSYSFDDTPDDFNLKHFDWGLSHDAKTKIPFAKRALNATGGRLRFFAAPWSPPAWMKGNNQMTSSSTPCLKYDKEERYHKAWALYLARWIQAYRKQGIRIWGLSVQNEVEFAAPWEACVWTPQEMRDFIANHLGPTFEKEVPDVKIMIYDHNKDHILKWASTIYSDPASAKYVWGTAFHWYSGDGFENLQAVYDSFPDKALLASEACNCPGVIIDDWTRAEAYGHDILGDLNNYAVGWVDWNLILDHEGGPNHLSNFCDAPMIADLRPGSSRSVHIQPTYYYLGHFSRFLPPGSVRLHAKVEGNPLMEVTAFRTPEGRIVVIAINRSDYHTQFKLKLAGAKEAARIEFYEHSIMTLIL